MIPGWSRVRLGDVLDVKHGYAFKGKHFATSGDALVLTPGNFRIGGGLQVRSGKERYYSHSFPSQFRLDPGAIVIAMTDLTQGAPILGSPLRVPDRGTYLHNQRIGRLEFLDGSALHPSYGYYLFVWDGVRAQIRASATGATVRHTAPERVRNVVVPLPPVSVQVKIAAILGAYDLFESSSFLRGLLTEEMARLLYVIQSAEWQPRPLETLAEPISEPFDEGVAGNLPLLDLGRIPRRSWMIGALGQPTELGTSRCVFRAGDILFGKVRPGLHKVVRPAFDGVTNSSVFVLRPHEPQCGSLLLAALSSDTSVSWSDCHSSGTKMPVINWSSLRKLPVAWPQAHRTSAFEALVDATGNASSQARLARQTRDYLLTPLMTGEIDVERLDIAVPEVAAA